MRYRLDALRAKLHKMTVDLPELTRLLADYEATGDHRHYGNRSIRPGESCPGGDCYVAKTRALIAALVEVL